MPSFVEVISVWPLYVAVAWSLTFGNSKTLDRTEWRVIKELFQTVPGVIRFYFYRRFHDTDINNSPW